MSNLIHHISIYAKFCVFNKQSLFSFYINNIIIYCSIFICIPFSQSYRVILPSSLKIITLIILVSSTNLPLSELVRYFYFLKINYIILIKRICIICCFKARSTWGVGNYFFKDQVDFSYNNVWIIGIYFDSKSTICQIHYPTGQLARCGTVFS